MSRLNELKTALRQRETAATPQVPADAEAATLRAQRARNDSILRTLRAAAETVVEPLRRAWRLRRTVAALRRLGDEQLRDIGLDRSEIPAFAARAVAAELPARQRRPGLLARLRRARSRRAMIRELDALPDRVLDDIGVPRSEIAAMVERTLDRQDRGAAGPAHAAHDRAGGPVRRLRQWHLSRIAAGDMARLDRATLSDLGYVKGDIDWVPEVLARRRIERADNDRATPAKVA